MKGRWFISGLIALALVAGVTLAPAQEGQEMGGGADMAAMMKEWEKWSAPCPMHKHLEKLVGTWNAVTKMSMDPSAPAVESKGVATNTLIMGGRWLRQDYKGEMMGMPFEGVGMLGYDNFKKQFIGSWIDNASTMMMHSMGTANESGTEFNLSGTMDEPITGERDKKFRHAWKIASADSHTFEAYDNIPGKGEVKVLEITYTRVK
jgi:hypothetical protein